MKTILLISLAALLTACAEIGSDEWCENLADQPKGDWTANEATDYTKYCVIGLNPDRDKR